MAIGFNNEKNKENSTTFNSLLGEYVRITTHQGPYFGKLDYTDSDTTITNPSLIELPFSYEKQDKDIIISIMPIPKTALEEIIGNTEISNENKGLLKNITNKIYGLINKIT